MNNMYYQPTLFDIDQYDISQKLNNIVLRIGLNPSMITIDKLQKISKMYGISANLIWQAYEKNVINNEKFSYNPDH